MQANDKVIKPSFKQAKRDTRAKGKNLVIWLGREYDDFTKVYFEFVFTFWNREITKVTFPLLDNDTDHDGLGKTWNG